MTGTSGGAPLNYNDAFPVVSAAGDRVAIAQGDVVALYEIANGRRIGSVKHSAPIATVAFSKFGHWLVSGSLDGRVLLSDDGKEPLLLVKLATAVDVVEFLSDGRIVVIDMGGSLRVYDSADRSLLQQFEVHGRVRAIRSSADAQRLMAVPQARFAFAVKAAAAMPSAAVRSRVGNTGRSAAVRLTARGSRSLSHATQSPSVCEVQQVAPQNLPGK